MIYKNLLRPILFSLEAERAHEIGSASLRVLSRFSPILTLLRNLTQGTPKPVEAFGLQFPNAIGQAAGLDKDGMFPVASEALGFGHIEVGTVTPLPQPGNEKPRLFRFPNDSALVNRMGFNNFGAEALHHKISKSFPKSNRRVPLGVNLGKGKQTALEDALIDYCKGFDVLAADADYITINISSPNTPNLRKLQESEYLEPLLAGIKNHRLEWSKSNNVHSPPCLLKISPDESYKSLETIVAKAVENSFDGLIACNTSITQPASMSSQSLPQGGISGKPIEKKSNDMIKFIGKLTNNKFPIIGSGGIYDYDSAQRKLDAGAVLLQIYTSFIYEGPTWPYRLAKRMPLAKGWS
jgi:dihydroorotate dehydrogenase